MRIWIIIFFIGLGNIVNAQQVIHNGKVHVVKGKSIFHNDVDITSTLLSHERESIYKTLKNNLKERKDAEKVRKKLEKAAKKAEKAQKKAFKALKKKQKAQDKFYKATKKLEQNQDKYDKLKMRGKLSPNDEAKWFKKLQGLKKDLKKTKNKLQRS